MLHSSDSYCSKVNCNSYFERHYTIIWASQVARLVKNLPAIAGDSRDVGSIPGSDIRVSPEFPISDWKDVSLPPGTGKLPCTQEIYFLFSGGKRKVRVSFLHLLFLK